jgi:hypothetical protein
MYYLYMYELKPSVKGRRAIFAAMIPGVSPAAVLFFFLPRPAGTGQQALRTGRYVVALRLSSLHRSGRKQSVSYAGVPNFSRWFCPALEREGKDTRAHVWNACRQLQTHWSPVPDFTPRARRKTRVTAGAGRLGRGGYACKRRRGLRARGRGRRRPSLHQHSWLAS